MHFGAGTVPLVNFRTSIKMHFIILNFFSFFGLISSIYFPLFLFLHPPTGSLNVSFMNKEEAFRRKRRAH